MLSAEYVDGHSGRLFCTLRLPDGRWDVPGVLVIPAFGDEMNKIRRMVTETARRLNSHGIGVVIPDLYGTGDSEGRFQNASWDGWISDLDQVAQWAIGRGMRLEGFLAARAGALLACQLGIREHVDPRTTVLWQPVRKGEGMLKQMLRMRTMATAVNAGRRETVQGLLEEILSGRMVDAGGYSLTRALVATLIELDIDKLDIARLGGLYAVETVRDTGRCGSYTELIAGREIEVLRLLGEPYWNATEIVCDMNIVGHTARLFEEALVATA